MTHMKNRGSWFPVLGSAVLVLGSAVLVPGSQAQAAEPPNRAPVVYSAEVDSIIHPVSAEYMTQTLTRADAEGAALVVFILRTPGGLVDSTRQIITRMIAARTPTVVYVAPSGARAASAGFLLTIAADIAAMAPGTHIGAAHPVAGGGERMDETMSKKAAEDVAAYARTLAAKRGRNEQLAEQAVMESKAFTDQEALKASPPLIDLVAADLPDLLKKIDGRSVSRFDGRSETLHTGGATVIPVQMTWPQRILSAVAHPNVAYLLLTLGTLGLTIEMWNPGAVLPGVVGGLSLILAFFALQVLPINFAGVALLIFGLVLLLLEIKVTSYGLLTIGGVVSLIFGSLMLIDSPAPELQVSLSLVIPVVLGFTGIAAFLVRLALAAQRAPAVTGPEALTHETGETLTDLEPGQRGRVRVHGEIWQAISQEPIKSGEPVKVTKVDGLTLTVRRSETQHA